MTQNGHLYRYLLRWTDCNDELYYAGGYQAGTYDADSDELIGVARTPKGQRPDTADNVGTFKQNVEELAAEVRWFGEPMNSR